MLDVKLSLLVQMRGRTRFFDDAAKGLEVFSKAPNPISFADMDPILKDMMSRFLKSIAALMRTRHSGSWPTGTGPSALSRRSGKLIESIARSIRVTGSFSRATRGIEGKIGSPLVYANLQEVGGTISRKNVRWLTVPLPAAMDNKGIMIFPKARDYPNTFVQRSRKGNLLIFQRRGPGQIIPLFVLKEKVEIPARLNLGVTLNQQGRVFLDAMAIRIFEEFKSGRL